jgi:hypothetical protein
MNEPDGREQEPSRTPHESARKGSVEGSPRDGDAVEEYEDEQPRNPFDNPWFLPLMLGAFALWCGYDGFVSDKFADRSGTLWFNRIAFLVLGALSAWLSVRARRETQAAAERD